MTASGSSKGSLSMSQLPQTQVYPRAKWIAWTPSVAHELPRSPSHRRSGTWLLPALGATLAYGIIRYAGVLPVDRYVLGLILATVAVIYYSSDRRYHFAPPVDGRLSLAALTLVSYVALQVVPLPLGMLRILSPARAEIAAAVGGGWAPLSVVWAETVLHLVTLCSCLLTFLLVRETKWRLEGREWLAAVPIVVLASLEAALGMAQFFSNRPGGVAHGTYINRNHFAGLLEMARPFSVALAVVALRAPRSRHRRQKLLGPTIKTAAALSAAALILAGVIHSYSRMGFVTALLGLGVTVLALKLPGSLSGGTRFSGRRLVAAGVAIGVLTGVIWGFVFLPPDQLIARFAQLAATDEISADMRLEIWNETLRLIAAYPVFGCGLGGYESAFLKYKSVAPMNTVDYAHSDYLQCFAELGGLGILLCAGIAVFVLRSAVRGAEPLGAASIGALTAVALHSLVDFNLYIPVNLMVVSWIAALAMDTNRA